MKIMEVVVWTVVFLLLVAGQNFDLADTALEAAASQVNQQPQLAVSLDFSRSVKKDVYQLVQGPCEEDSTFYLLAGEFSENKYLANCLRSSIVDPE